MNSPEEAVKCLRCGGDLTGTAPPICMPCRRAEAEVLTELSREEEELLYEQEADRRRYGDRAQHIPRW